MVSSESLAGLAHLLRRRMEVVADRAFYERDPEGHLKALQEVSRELDQNVEQLNHELPPQLRHYFERQSYQKALDYLESPSPS